MIPVLAMIWGGPWDIAIVAGVVVLLFGGAKIGGFGKNLGQGMREFKNAMKETQEDEPAKPPVSDPPKTEAKVKDAEPVGAAAKSTSEETNKEP